MKKIILIVPIIFLFILAINVKAQIAIPPPIKGECPDTCINVTLYLKGTFDEKTQTCIYDLTDKCIEAINGECPDKCMDSTLYLKGELLDPKTNSCSYGYTEFCKYGCRLDDKSVFPEPACNALPPQDTSTSLEKIYSDILKIQNQTSNTDANYQKLYDEIAKLKAQIYQNSPSITVHGTEYTIGETGKVWVQVLDANKTAVDNATCLVDIYTPCGSRLVEKEPMSFLEDGVYYYNFIAPSEIGVYPSIVECYYISTTAINLASSGVVVTGTTISGDYISTHIFDENYWVVREASLGGKQRIQTLMNFSNVSQPVLQSNLNIIWTGIWNSAPNTDSISIYIMNFTSGNWVLLPNAIDDTGGSEMTIANSIATANATSIGLVKNGIVSIMFNDTNGTDSSATLFKSDYVHIDVVAQFSPQYQQIIGSGEIHVSSPLNLPYTKETLCGTVNGEITEGKESSCSIFTHTGEFPYAEGEIEDNITITALETKADQLWSYTTPSSVSCDAIYWLKYYNGTGWINVDLSGATYFTNSDSSCKISVPIDLVKGQTYSYQIKMDNYIKWEADWLYDQIYNLRVGVEPTCDAYAMAGNYTYTFPLLNGTVISNDTYLATCHRLYDDFYWSEWYHNNSVQEYMSGFALSDLYSLRSYANSINPRILLLGEGIIVGNILSINTSINISSLSIINDGIKFIGGTEYSTGESGLTSVQFLKGGNPVNTGTCNATIYYPNGTMFINNQAMTYLSGSNGIYSRTFTVPNTIGVYREQFLCSHGGFDYHASGSFHNSDWANNITNIYQLLQYMNSTESLHFNSLYNLMLSVNASIIQQINAINATINSNIFAINQSIFNQLYSMTGKLQEIQDNITNVYNLIGASNATIMQKLFKIQEEITSMNDTIKSINQSIESHLNGIDTILNSMQSDLSQIKGNLTEIKALSQEINVTVNGIVGLLGNLSNDISGLNSSLIAHIDTSLTNLEFNLTNLIISVNNTVLASNITIMSQLYAMQAEIADLNQTIINGLLNISNVTVNITASQQEVIKTMFALFGSQAKNRNYAYLGIGGGLTGFLTGDSGAVYYCKDNMTLAQYGVQNQNWTGSINMTNSAITEDLQHCTYGCVQNACVIPQYMIWAYILFALVIIFGIYLWIEKVGWLSSEE